ncbi:hypothetical protein [Cetobacterium sp. SF1]|uniref:hypothetical protein n=1 Tax=Cetobacterium sp. SF1 TaxID=3417654 RepID=UPI003CF3E8B3
MKEFLISEVLDTPATEIIEENLILEDTVIQNGTLIRMDINIVQYPIFSKNTRRKINQVVKYYFNNNRETYITVSPISGDHIPGEFEEKVFIALLRIMKKRKFGQTFTISSGQIKDELGINLPKIYDKIKKSLFRLSKTNYAFKNTLYSSEIKGILSSEISTNIFNLKKIDLTLKENYLYEQEISDGRIKEIYEISLSNYFYENIIRKGYLVYDSNILLNIKSSIGRTLYMLIEKLRYNEVFLKVKALFLIKRIPLKFDKNNIGRTIKIIINSLEELKEMNLILSFEVTKETTWENCDINIYFPNEIIQNKQNRFFEDLNEYKKISKDLAISSTENKQLKPEEDIPIKIEVTNDMILSILDILPKKAKSLKTMPRAIKEAIEEYSYAKVKSVALYMKKQKVTNMRAYFQKALKEGWAEDYIEICEKKEQPKDNIKSENKINEIIEKLKILPKEKYELIAKEAYKDYIKQCGIETSIQKLAFKAGKEIIIGKFIEKNPEYFKELENEKNELNIFNSFEELKAYVHEYIRVCSKIYDFTSDEVDKLIKETLLELTPKFIENKLTKKDLQEILLKNIRKDI